MISFLLPPAFPSVAIYVNVARIFYGLGLAGTIGGVVLVHAVHALVYSVWITSAAFAAVDRELELAARNLGASVLRTLFTVTLPLAAPSILAWRAARSGGASVGADQGPNLRQLLGRPRLCLQ